MIQELDIRVPSNKEDFHRLQRDTTELLRTRRLLVAKNKLCAGTTTDGQRTLLLAKFASDREILAAAGQPGASTRAVYWRRGKGLWDKNVARRPSFVWALAAESCRNKATWYATKAALQFFLMEEMHRCKQDIDSWYRQDVSVRAETQVRQKLKELARQLVKLGRALEASPLPGELPPKFVTEPVPHTGQLSKSASIRGRPPSWRQQVAEELAGEHKLLYLIQCVSGCRPVELDKYHGVTVVLESDGHLRVTTRGAKLSKTAGQPIRELVFENLTGLTKDLANLLEPGVPVQSSLILGKVANANVGTYRTAIARAGSRAFEGDTANKRLTAYSARHQFMADLRTAGFSREKIAQAMGHRTVKSAVYYGRKGRGSSGGVVPSQVTATYQAKKRSPHPAQRVSATKQPIQQHSPVLPVPKARRPKP